MFWIRVSVYLFCLSLTLPVWAGFNPIQIDGPLAAQRTQPVYQVALASPNSVEPAAQADSGATQQELVEPHVEADEEEMALTTYFSDIEKAGAEAAELMEESPFEESDGIMVHSEQGEVLLEDDPKSSL